jgi:hypothetical protein
MTAPANRMLADCARQIADAAGSMVTRRAALCVSVALFTTSTTAAARTVLEEYNGLDDEAHAAALGILDELAADQVRADAPAGAA